MKRTATALCLLWMMWGCASSEDDGGSSLAIEEVPALYAAALCEAIDNCLGPLAASYRPGEDCVTTTQPAIEDELPRLQAAIDAGRIRYDGAKMEACIAEIGARDCETFNDRDSDVCRAALDGTQDVGEDCTMDEECSGEAYCKMTASCPGVCAELEGEGSACEQDDHCASGLTCEEGSCQRRAGAGDLCQEGYPECALGYVCAGADASAGQPGNCRAFEEVFTETSGATCDVRSGQMCEPGLSCQVDAVTAGALTMSCAARSGSGAACKVAFPDPCPDDEYCQVPTGSLEGMCSPKPGNGEACAAGPFSEEGSICAPNLRCDGGTCRALAHLGEPCVSDEVCYSNHCEGGECVSDGACP